MQIRGYRAELKTQPSKGHPLFENLKQVNVGRIPFTAINCEVACERIIGMSKKPTGVSIHLWNTYCVGLFASNPLSRIDLSNKTIFLADGKPISLIMKFKSPQENGNSYHVRGSDLFREVLSKGIDQNLRHAFYGSTPETLQQLVVNVREQYPGLQIVDYFAPGFSPVDEKLVGLIDSRIVSAKPNIVWLGFGTPKQDKISERLKRHDQVMTIGVGAAFDFIAGVKREAPRWISMLGAEWLFRLGSEPKRLFKRYSIGSVWFILAILGWQKK
jgi:N-acetylglucosaminyldiphosphoundecaprenol N-acetyl-beta-D-mannosaminyltransferase